MAKPKVIDCFSGAGGLSLGFKMAGFDTKYAFDFDATSIKTYNNYFGNHGFVDDIKKVSKSSIEAKIGEKIDDIDVVIGGPPCQGFSVQRRGDDLDDRNNLVAEFVRLVIEINPKFFLMENVGGLLAPRGKAAMRHLQTEFEKNGFYLHIAKLNSYDYGVPQVRKRVFIVGEKLNNSLARFSFPGGSNGNGGTKSAQTVRSAIWDLMNKTESDIANHKADKLSAINIKRIQSVTEGQGRDSLPIELQLDCHKNNKSHRHLDVYGRMSWDNPSPTITARFDSFSRGRFGHPQLDRTVTLREGARLQTFPDDFVFFGTKVEVARQIGNAVPPLMAKAIAERIKECL